MSEQPPGHPPNGEAVFSRVSLAFAVRSLWRLVSNADDLCPTDLLIVLAVWNSNSRHLSANPASLHAVCFPDHRIPEAAKRPVSRNAISRFLNLPFETSRRRIESLLRKDILADAGGALVCTGSCEGYVGGFGADTAHRPETLAWMYGRLAASGLVLPDAGWMSGGATVHQDLSKAVSMLSAELLLLYLSEAFRTFDHGVLPVLMLLSIAHRGDAHLLGLGGYRPIAGDSDGFIHGVTTRKQLAQLLNRPAETVRRVALDLIERGLVIERGDGLVASDEISKQLQAPTFVRHNRIAAMRVFASLNNLSGYSAARHCERLAS